MTNKPIVVLVAEDDEHEIITIRRAWKKQQIANRLYIVNDGHQCLDYLYQRGAYRTPGLAPRPHLLLLDINMPRMDGLTVLKNIRKSEEFGHLPVIMLTTSKAEQDRIKSYSLGANAYIVKPVGFNNFSKAIKAINLFWQLAEFPVTKKRSSFNP